MVDFKKSNERNKIVLPRTYKGEQKEFHGLPCISWSQIETWNDKKGFNTGLPGYEEYMLKYFFGAEFKDTGWGQFGTEVEAYITLRNLDRKTLDANSLADLEASERNLSSVEKDRLKDIKPLGIFQEEVCVNFGDFIVFGFKDDVNEDHTHLRDYKTKSASSKTDLTMDKKHQLELYVLDILQRGYQIPTTIEYTIIERLGGKACFDGGGRKSLTVGPRIWTEHIKITPERLEVTKELVIKAVHEISDMYKVFLKINK